MATNYPDSLDNFINPSNGDKLDSPSHSGQHADANDAVTETQIKLGVGNSSAGSASVGHPLVHNGGGTTTWSKVGDEGITSGTAQFGRVLTSQGDGTTSFSSLPGLTFIEGYAVNFAANVAFSNDVFNNNFENYLLVLNDIIHNSSSPIPLKFVYRINGTANTTANYNTNTLIVNGATVTGSRTTGGTAIDIVNIGSTWTVSSHVNIYNPKISSRKFVRSSTNSSEDDGRIQDSLGLFTGTGGNQFDSFSVFVPAGGIGFNNNFSGTLYLYGYQPRIVPVGGLL